uniref:Uncharacterized protein n=1 Tax=Trypanosoma congolense (strain IL3000) TaxID=1068625 RepID=G0UNR0_TRYCI|nr:hypothetical protein, unlikely [Trypanosoma congolense IL3000]
MYTNIYVIATTLAMPRRNKLSETKDARFTYFCLKNGYKHSEKSVCGGHIHSFRTYLSHTHTSSYFPSFYVSSVTFVFPPSPHTFLKVYSHWFRHTAIEEVLLLLTLKPPYLTQLTAPSQLGHVQYKV